ncbi:helix-turn-helix domain-containing protein [Patulibacter defluvii]|uniref:helix-turn-helix domain-containing protein n=1 Tax=Patulibacter defluvii TaxID=3095358 RepID=UPI002A750E71|nr:helix-turn-helix transcriptional regulator [Patulibacter sp. DM4]
MPRRPVAPDPIAAAFGRAIRHARTARGETLEDVAGRIPTTGRNGRGTMDPRYLGEIEAGWHAPSIVRAVAIAEALETSLADLVGVLDARDDSV